MGGCARRGRAGWPTPSRVGRYVRSSLLLAFAVARPRGGARLSPPAPAPTRSPARPPSRRPRTPRSACSTSAARSRASRPLGRDAIARERRHRLQPPDGRRALLLARFARRRHPARPAGRLRLRPLRLGYRREHRLGHGRLLDARVDRGDVDELERAPREHPQLPLQGDRDRHRARQPARRRRAAPPTPPTSETSFAAASGAGSQAPAVTPDRPAAKPKPRARARSARPTRKRARCARKARSRRAFEAARAPARARTGRERLGSR